jgi:flagellar capping protein FliD
VNTGKPGSVLGTTDRLQLDEAKLASALEKDPTAVADLLNSASGALKSTVTALDGWTTTGGRITKALEGITSQLKALDTQETRVNDRITLKQAALQTKFASMEKTLALLQTTTDSLTQSITQANKSNG